MNGSLDKLGDSDLQRILGQFRSATDPFRDNAFESVYFDKRFDLATSEPTFVSTKLRRFLSMGVPDNESPRLKAIARWAESAFRKDMLDAVEKGGLPRKTIVFTSWVGGKKIGEAKVLRDCLSKSYSASLEAVCKKYGRRWLDWSTIGKERLKKAAEEMSATSLNCERALLAFREDMLTSVLVGRYPQIANRLKKSLKARLGAIESAISDKSRTTDLFAKRAIDRRVKDLRATLSPLTSGKKVRSVECYTSHEGRSDRDRYAAAFREVGLPWVLVASNIGAEGIDLHTYTARIVHYDLEWNPAKMEQREGRGDRVGRRLKEKLMILYCLVPRTYDERMFHQLVARDRWHGVLLGKPSSKLADDAVDAPLIPQSLLDKMRLDLAPRI